MAPIIPTAKMAKIGATDTKSTLLSSEISFFGSCVSILVFRRCKIPVERNLCILQQKQCDRGKRKICPCAEVINHYAMSTYLGVDI